MGEQVASTIDATCRRLSIGKTTFHELVKQGRLRTFKLGRKTLVSEQEIWRFVEECQRANHHRGIMP